MEALANLVVDHRPPRWSFTPPASDSASAQRRLDSSSPLCRGLFGIGFLLYGLFWLLAEQMTGPAAAACFGLVALGLTGGIAWTARRIIW